MRFRAIAALLLVAAVAGAVIAAEAPGPVAAPPGPGGERMRPQGDPGQMLDLVLERLGLTEAEKAAVKKAARAKMEAAAPLTRELQALGQTARNDEATDQELKAALRRFDAALLAYRQKAKAIDAQLIKALSLRARAALTAMGVLDNGMGMRMGGRMRPGGMGGPGAEGMRRPGGGGWGGPGQDSQGPRVIR
jgi:Spy/CpxP family protein refolding chaperone